MWPRFRYCHGFPVCVARPFGGEIINLSSPIVADFFTWIASKVLAVMSLVVVSHSSCQTRTKVPPGFASISKEAYARTAITASYFIYQGTLALPSCITLRARAVPDIRVAIIEDQAEMRDGLTDLIKLWQNAPVEPKGGYLSQRWLVAIQLQ
jgi:hypothetical protein